MAQLKPLGKQLRVARKKSFPKDDLQSFALRLGVARATLQKMEQGDLSVSMDKYYRAAKLLGVDKQFEALFILPESLFDD